MNQDNKKLNFSQSVVKLEEINTWFQNDEIDLDEGLKKLREGKDLIIQCKQRLKEVENEFYRIKEEFTEVSDDQALENDEKSQKKTVEPDDFQF